MPYTQSQLNIVAPMEDIRAFCVAAGVGSFSGAAQLLNTTHSSVSRRVSHLESWIGFRLFERKARGLELTPRGRRFFERCQQGLLAIDDAIFDTRVSSRQQEVTVSTIGPFAHFCLIPRFATSALDKSPYRLRVVTSNDVTNFRDETDLAIRVGTGQWIETISEPIWDEWDAPIAARSLVEQCHAPQTPQELLEFPLVHVRTDFAWRHWFEGHGIPYIVRHIDHVFDCQILALSAIRAGLGFGLNRPLIAAHVDELDMYHAPFERVRRNVTFHLVRHSTLPMREPAKLFARHFLSSLGVSEERILRFCRNTKA